MNNTHVTKEQHSEEAKSQWWDGALQGLAQRSGSAGNYNHNHIQCTSHAYYYALSSPRRHHSQQVSLRLLRQLYLYVCAEKLAKRNFLFFFASILTAMKIRDLGRHLWRLRHK